MTTPSSPADLNPNTWPALPLDAWQETYTTLHLWTQIVGKIRLMLCSPVNHWWHVALYVTSRGLTTSPIPSGTRSFTIDFDFIDHQLRVQTSDGGGASLGLYPRSVADFYRELMDTLRALDIEVKIYTLSQEMPNPVYFEQDEIHASYDRVSAETCWRILVQVDRVFKTFRSGFIGKCSPVHFFWGSFDLAVTRFSGRRAPERPGADRMTREGYSHEVSSVGFWPGSAPVFEPAFYAYAAPAPTGFDQAVVRPACATYNPQLGEFLLRYEDVRTADDPDAMLLDFCQSTYDAAADLAGWDRAALER